MDIERSLPGPPHVTVRYRLLLLPRGLSSRTDVKTQWRAEKLFVKEEGHFVEHKVLNL